MQINNIVLLDYLCYTSSESTGGDIMKDLDFNNDTIYKAPSMRESKLMIMRECVGGDVSQAADGSMDIIGLATGGESRKPEKYMLERLHHKKMYRPVKLIVA